MKDDVQDHPEKEPLSREEEARLWSLCGEGDEEARERLILSYRPLVFWIARKYRVAPQRYQDLIQEGMLALIKAVDRFEPDRNIRFVTYGFYRIKGQMTNFLQRVEAKAPSPVDDAEVQVPDPFDADSLDWKICLADGIEALTGREGDIVRALVLEGLKARDYAESAGMDVSNVYRIQRRALAKLKAWLELGDATDRP
ncbi:MAG: sigma-70 family RNA polymerase sigma factor [Synergistales bacterium]|nr:sigma-70 family RNA polymerase sigma factor [Synergistales bacterium]HOC82329.1 sigma-70 family RNA polymerase sigma factor [Synergistales bacterium]HQL02690.1 sigma-70 family RNA polymerase sigma factor [Synergistales bacterium]